MQLKDQEVKWVLELHDCMKVQYNVGQNIFYQHRKHILKLEMGQVEELVYFTSDLQIRT